MATERRLLPVALLLVACCLPFIGLAICFGINGLQRPPKGRSQLSILQQPGGIRAPAREVRLPNGDAQVAIAAALSRTGMPNYRDAEPTALDARLAKTHPPKQAMMHELPTGKARLI